MKRTTAPLREERQNLKQGAYAPSDVVGLQPPSSLTQVVLVKGDRNQQNLGVLMVPHPWLTVNHTEGLIPYTYQVLLVVAYSALLKY